MSRAVWKGSLGFGLVNIGIELHAAQTAAERIDLDLLDRRDMAPVGYQKVNKATGAPVAPADIVKGYQVSKGKYVLLDDAELKAANPRSTQTIDILGFMPATDVPLVYYDTPYYLKPTKGSQKAYLLFKDALEEQERLALAQLVVHTRQYRAAVYPFDGMLVAQLLRYHDELKSQKDLGWDKLPLSSHGSTAKERTMAKRLIDSMAIDWEPTQYRDEYRDDVMAMIRRRTEKGEAASVADVGEATSPTKVIDLMAALKASLEAGRGAAKAAKRSTRAKRSA